MSSAVAPQPVALDDWYRSINRIYLDRNFHRDAFSIYSHLVEVVGGLSLLASDKKKHNVDVESHVPKAVAWWLALCGKVGIKSVEQMLWWKFPNVCPYCQKNPHDNDICEDLKKNSPGPDWAGLEKIGEAHEHQRPKTIADWQKMFGSLYKVEATGSYSVVFARFCEELGELGEALRVFPVAPGYFLSEAADVFAWLMHLQNRVERGAGVPVSDRGKPLASHLATTYPSGCRDCGRPVCSCPAILPSTLGRIAHEVPHERMAKIHGDALLPLDDALALFGAVQSRVHLNGQVYELGREELRELNAAVSQLLKLTLDQGRDLGVQAALLVDSLHELRTQADHQRVTDEQLMRLAEQIAGLEPTTRQKFLGALGNAGIGTLSSGLVATVQTLVT